MMNSCFVFAFLIFVGLADPQGDWPQWGGPNRDFHVAGLNIRSVAPDKPLQRIWRRRVSPGHSGLAVAGGVLVTACREKNNDVIIALDAIVTSPTVLSSGRVATATCSYAALFDVTTAKNEQLAEDWRSTAITPQVGNLIEYDGLLIGPSSNTRGAPIAAVDISTGRRKWKERRIGIAFLLTAADGLIAVEENGDICFARIVDGKCLNSPCNRGLTRARFVD